MEKVIVTGVLQLIGFHLCNRLLNEGFHVVGIDTCTNNEKIKAEMLLSFGRNANFEFVNESLSNVNYENHIHEVKTFFHLREDPTTELEFNKIIAICEKLNVPIVFISSLEVYGNNQTLYTESSKLNPSTPLGKRKKQEEQLLLEKVCAGKNKCLIFRIPSVYGPWQSKNDCLHKHLNVHIKNNSHVSELKINHNFSKKYIYVDDVVEAIMLGFKENFTTAIYNLSVNEEKYSNDKIKEHLAFLPRYSFEDGLEKQKQHLLKILEVNPTIFEDEDVIE